MDKIRFYLKPLLFRAAGYAVIFTVGMTGIMHLSGGHFYENHFVEWLQFALLLVGAVLFATGGRRCQKHRALSLVFAGVLSMAAVRECDLLLDRHIFKYFWQSCVTLLFLATALVLLKNWRAFFESLNEFSNWNSFGIMFAGFLALLFSRVVGHNDFWPQIIGKKELWLLIRVIEETSEVLAYFLFFTGSIEYTLKLNANSASENSP